MSLVGQLTTTQLEYQRNIEEGLKKKAQGMLEEVLGPNRAIARVSADIDFSRWMSPRRDTIPIRSFAVNRKISNGPPEPRGLPPFRLKRGRSRRRIRNLLPPDPKPPRNLLPSLLRVRRCRSMPTRRNVSMRFGITKSQKSISTSKSRGQGGQGFGRGHRRRHL